MIEFRAFGRRLSRPLLRACRWPCGAGARRRGRRLQAAVRPPKLQYQIATLPQRAARHPVRGSLDADRARVALVPRRVEERAARAHRLRALLRAHDVQGLEERRARVAHVDHRQRRRPQQRLHHRGRDGVLADAAGAVPAAGAVDGSRPHGDAAHRRRRRSSASARWSRKSAACGSRTSPTAGSPRSSTTTRSPRTPTSTRRSAAWPTSRPPRSTTCASSTAPSTCRRTPR